MLVKIAYILGSSLLLLLVACNTSKPISPPHVVESLAEVEKEPAWVFSPTPPEGGLAGVGISGRHVKGPYAQRQLAISRALDEIARQMGVRVTNIVETQDYVTGSMSQSRMSSYSVQLSDGNQVTARLRESWRKPSTDELYIWMTTR